MDEIVKNDYNLNISRYVSTAEDELTMDLKEVHSELEKIETRINISTNKHNKFLKELGLKLI